MGLSRGEGRITIRSELDYGLDDDKVWHAPGPNEEGVDVGLGGFEGKPPGTAQCDVCISLTARVHTIFLLHWEHWVAKNQLSVRHKVVMHYAESKQLGAGKLQSCRHSQKRRRKREDSFLRVHMNRNVPIPCKQNPVYATGAGQHSQVQGEEHEESSPHLDRVHRREKVRSKIQKNFNNV